MASTWQNTLTGPIGANVTSTTTIEGGDPVPLAIKASGQTITHETLPWGVVGALLSVGGTTSTYLRWDDKTPENTATRGLVVFPVWLDTIPTTQQTLAVIRNTEGAIMAAIKLSGSSPGRLIASQTSSDISATLSAITLEAQHLYWVGLAASKGATTADGVIEWVLWDSNRTTVLETKTATGANTTTASPGEFRFSSQYLADIQAGHRTSGWPGKIVPIPPIDPAQRGVLRQNTAADGVVGQTVQSSDTGSGNAFDSVFISPGCSLVYTSDAPPGHTRAYQLSVGTSGSITFGWDEMLEPWLPIDENVVEMWFKLPNDVPLMTSSPIIARAYSDASRVYEARTWELLYDSRFRVFLRDIDNNTAFCRTPLKPNIWYRIEIRTRAGVQGQIKVSQGANTATVSAAVSSAWVGGTVAAWEYRFNASLLPNISIKYGPVRFGRDGDFFTPTIYSYEVPVIEVFGGGSIDHVQRMLLMAGAEGIDGEIVSHRWRRVSPDPETLATPTATIEHPPLTRRLTHDEVYAYRATDVNDYHSAEETVTYSVLGTAESSTVDGQDAGVAIWAEV